MVADKLESQFVFCFSSQSQDFKFIIFVSGRVINHQQLLLLLIIFLSLVYAMSLSSSFICYFPGQASSYMLIFFLFSGHGAFLSRDTCSNMQSEVCIKNICLRKIE